MNCKIEEDGPLHSPRARKFFAFWSLEMFPPGDSKQNRVSIVEARANESTRNN